MYIVFFPYICTDFISQNTIYEQKTKTKGIGVHRSYAGGAYSMQRPEMAGTTS